ncbi:hypothetical protein FPV67DRAFT_1458382 [Lyophyllum atratum]|nr:hypothetical protein FPV67DRAFT_1458382 [Lyophyllum atratum]
MLSRLLSRPPTASVHRSIQDPLPFGFDQQRIGGPLPSKRDVRGPGLSHRDGTLLPSNTDASRRRRDGRPLVGGAAERPPPLQEGCEMVEQPRHSPARVCLEGRNIWNGLELLRGSTTYNGIRPAPCDAVYGWADSVYEFSDDHQPGVDVLSEVGWGLLEPFRMYFPIISINITTRLLPALQKGIETAREGLADPWWGEPLLFCNEPPAAPFASMLEFGHIHEKRPSGWHHRCGRSAPSCLSTPENADHRCIRLGSEQHSRRCNNLISDVASVVISQAAAVAVTAVKVAVKAVKVAVRAVKLFMAKSKQVNVNGKMTPSSTLRDRERMANMRNVDAGITPVLRTIEWPQAIPPLPLTATPETQALSVPAQVPQSVATTSAALFSPLSDVPLELETETIAMAAQPVTESKTPDMLTKGSPVTGEITGEIPGVPVPGSPLPQGPQDLPPSLFSTASLEKDALGITAGALLPVALIEQMLALHGEIDDWLRGCRLQSALLLDSSQLDHRLNDTERSIQSKLATGSLARFQEIKIWQNQSESANILSRGIRARFESLIQTWAPEVSQGVILNMRLNLVNLLHLCTVLDAEHHLICASIRSWLLTPSAGVTNILADRAGDIPAGWKFGNLTRDDLKLLAPKMWLNDALLEHFISRPPPPSSVLCLSPFFYTKFLQNPPTNAKIWDQAWKWQSGQASSISIPKMVQSLNTILIPVNLKQKHWVLAHVDLKKHTIHVLDSLRSNYRKNVDDTTWQKSIHASII